MDIKKRQSLSGFFSEVKNVFKKELNIFFLILFLSFVVLWCGQMIAVVGGKKIIEPISITTNDDAASFKRFVQLARSGNYTLLTAGEDRDDQWKVGGIFVKKMVLGFTREDQKKIKDVKIKIGSTDFSFNNNQISSWSEVGVEDFYAYIQNDSDKDYVFFEVPESVALPRSRLPLYQGFFGSLINWSGDEKIFLNPLKKALALTFEFSVFLLLVRFVLLFITWRKPAVLKHDLDEEEKNRFVVFVSTIFLTVISLVLISGLIYIFYHPDIEVTLRAASENYLNYFFKSFRPKPVERMQFLVSVFCTPFLLLFFYKFLNRRLSSIKEKIVRLYPWFVGATLFSLAMIVYCGLAMSNFFFINDSIFFTPWVKYFFSLIIFPVALFYIFTTKKLDKRLRVLFQILVVGIIGLVFFMNIINLNDSFLSANFDPVFYPVTQTLMGKTPTVNLNGLYGMYPLFLVPIFKIIGLSVLKFTIIFAILIALSVWLLFRFILRVVKSETLAYLGFFMVIFYSLLATRVTPDCYFQYWPIRFTFPCLFLFLTAIYFKNKSKILYYGSFPLYAAGIFWNFDVGVVVFATWCLSLLYSELLKNISVKEKIKNIFLHFVVGIFSLILTAGLLALIVYLRNGEFPSAEIFFQTQKMFLSGYLMIKMILPPHTWTIPVLIYIMGLLYAIIAFVKRHDGYQEKIIFVLSILGIGLFSYYEGQSSDVTLFRTSYPALILSVLFADILWGNRRKIDGVPLFLALFYFILSALFSIVINLPKYTHFIATGVPLAHLENSRYLRDIEYLKQSTEYGEKTLILAPPDQAVYYGESGTVSAVDIPSILDVAFPREMDELLNFLKNNKEIKVFVREPLDQYNYFSPEIKKIISENYYKYSSSEDNLILYKKLIK